MSLWSSFRAEVRAWAAGRNWLARAPVLLLFAWVFTGWLADPAAGSVFSGLNLGLHELGHVLFRPMGEWWSVAGGSITQLAAPFSSLIMFLRQRDYFALTFSFGWLAVNLFEMATYIGDARAQVIPLVSPFGGEVWHDWDYLLSRAGLLPHDHAIAAGVRLAGAGVMALGLAYGAWVLWQMARAPRERTAPG